MSPESMTPRDHRAMGISGCIVLRKTKSQAATLIEEVLRFEQPTLLTTLLCFKSARRVIVTDVSIPVHYDFPYPNHFGSCHKSAKSDPNAFILPCTFYKGVHCARFNVVPCGSYE